MKDYLSYIKSAFRPQVFSHQAAVLKQPSRHDLIQKRAELFHEHLVLRNNFTRRTT